MTSADGCLYLLAAVLAAIFWAIAFRALLHIKKATMETSARLVDVVRLLDYIARKETLTPEELPRSTVLSIDPRKR